MHAKKREKPKNNSKKVPTVAPNGTRKDLLKPEDEAYEKSIKTDLDEEFIDMPFDKSLGFDFDNFDDDEEDEEDDDFYDY